MSQCFKLSKIIICNNIPVYMSLKSQNSQILYKYFKAKITMENQLDKIKSQLYQNPNFSPYHLFKQIDVQDKGRIGLQDILKFVTSSGLNATFQQIQGVLLYFTKENYISITKFIQALIPKAIRLEQNSQNMCSVAQSFTKLIFSIVDHNEQIKTISKLTELMDENNFDFNFGVLPQFAPQHLILLFNSFEDELDGVSFQIIFADKKSISWQDIKQKFVWKPIRRQPRLSQDLHSRKREFQRKTSFNFIFNSEGSTQQQSPDSTTKIKFCKAIDIDVFDREAHLYN